MTENELLKRAGRIDRRKFIAGVGTGVATGVAGCLGFGGGGEGNGGNGGGTGTETSQPKNVPTGGKPILGMATAPDSLNALASSTAYTFALLNNIYTYGTYTDPNSGKPIPGGFKDWTLTAKNVGTGKPTIVADLRDDLTFNDGKKVTAEDYKFTVEYIKEQQPAGSISASQFSSVESVEVDKPKGTTVNFFLKEKDRSWLSSVLGNIILPKHVWKNVSDYKKYKPRNSKEGIVGSGPFKLSDYNWGNWFELKRREKSAIPWNQAYDFLNSEGPFIDALRVEIFGTTSALNQAILNEDIDQTYQSVLVGKAAEATEKNSLEVKQSKDDGWEHFSFNTRRVPLDDPAFRQLLVKMQDKQWTVEKLFKGIGAERGTYATLSKYGEWRPPEPSKVNGKFKGISIPDLTFPGKRGSFNINQSGVDAARTFLTENKNAKHDYSIGPAKTSKVNSPDNKEIYVNGKPLGQAHTDNNGASGQGPLEMSFNPANKQPKQYEVSTKWVNALRKVGVPVENAVQSFNSQSPKVFENENFDMYEMGWTSIGWINDHYTQFYSSEGADLDGTKNAQNYNTMAYTNADKLINKQGTMMKVEPRKPVVKKVLARIYHDAPTNIAYYNIILQPVTKKFGGRIKLVGGVTNEFTWMNIHKKK